MVFQKYICGYGIADSMGTLRSIQKWDKSNKEWKNIKLEVTSDFIKSQDWFNSEKNK